MSMPSSVLAAIVSRAWAGTCGLSAMLSLNPLIRLRIRIAPTRAVPIEAPRLRAVPCRPPVSLALEGSVDDMITLPSCEASRPPPAPIKTMAILNPVSLRFTSSVASITTAPALIRTSPACATVLGDRLPAILGPANAKISIAAERGSSRLPVSNAFSPITTCR